jgi:hypothetical protein
MLALVPLAAALGLAAALPPAGAAATQKWYERAVKKVSAEITPAEAKPGQTVTFTLTVELNDGYHTYPTVQSDKSAAGMVNVFKFPDPGTVIFVGELENPRNAKTKADPEAGISELKYYPGKATYTRKAVVSPAARPGATTVKLTAFKLSVCDAERCFPQKDVPVEVPLKVLEAAPVPVDPAYADEVRKALGK